MVLCGPTTMASAALKTVGLQRTVLLLALTKAARSYVSPPILLEYRTVLARPELGIRKGSRLQLLQLIENRARLVSPDHRPAFVGVIRRR